jgi:hypothetical protein
LKGDVRINGLTLNSIDENDIVWVCREIEGWWNLSSVESPDIARGLDDGSYNVRGRRTARSITLEGSILVPDPSWTAIARKKLLETANLVYEGGWLYVDESPTKAAYVRLIGQPTINNVNARGRIDFSIPLRAGDPIKYTWNENHLEGFTVVGLTNLLSVPGFENSTTGWSVQNGTAATSTADKYEGSYSLLATANGSGTFGPRRASSSYYPSIIPGETYTFSIYAKDINTAGTYTARIGWLDSANTQLQTSIGQPIAISSSSWTRYTVTAIAPKDAVKAIVYCYSAATPTNGTQAYFDAAYFHLGTSALTYTSNNVSNLAINNSGNSNVAVVYKMTGPITAPAYIRSTSGNTTQTITVNTNLRDTTTTASIDASEFSAGVATITTTTTHSFLVGDLITVDASNNYYDAATAVKVTAVTDTSISYANPIANITSITHSSNRADVITDAAHGLSAGDTFYIGGSSNPIFDGAYTVLASPTPTSTTFSYTKTTSNQTTGYGGQMSRQIAYSSGTTGTVTLAQTDTLEIDTYNKTVLYRGLPDSSRSTLAVNVDWIQLQPGDNNHTVSVTGGTGNTYIKYRSGWIG